MVPWVAGTWSPPMTTLSGKRAATSSALAAGEPHRPFPRRFSGDFGLVDLRASGAEGQAKPFQQGGAIT